MVGRGAKPVTKMAIDRRQNEATVHRCLGQQHVRRRETCERKGKRCCQAARGGKTHAHAGEAARPNGDGHHIESAFLDPRLVEQFGNRRKQVRGLLAPLFAMDSEEFAVAYHGETEAAHGAIIGKDKAHR